MAEEYQEYKNLFSKRVQVPRDTGPDPQGTMAFKLGL